MRHSLLVVITLFTLQFIFKPFLAFAVEEVLKKTEFEELVVALKINYVETDIISTTLKTHNNDILVPLSDLTGFNIKDEYLERTKATINNIEYINISKIIAIDYQIDFENLILSINFPPAAMQMQHINVLQERNVSLEGYRGIPLKAFFLNYEVTTTRESNKYSMAGVQELNYSDGKSYIKQTVFTKHDFFAKKRMIPVRLDTTLTFDNEEQVSQWRFGDSITNGPDWSSTTRFAGIQRASDFTLKPNLITYPLLDFKGRADLPTALDVYINSQLIYKTQLKTGEFNMNNLPVTAGQGSLEVKQRDITGKLQTITIPYYVAPALLDVDLVDYSMDLGSQRVGFGSVSNKYRYLITSFDYNKGMSHNWTSGVHFESMKDVFAIGATNLYKIGTYGVVSGSIATSGPKLSNAQKAILGYSFQGQAFSFSIQQMMTGKNFLNTFNLDTSGLGRSTQGSASYSLNDKSSVGFSYLNAIAKLNGVKSQTEMLTVSYQNNLTKNSSLQISAGSDLKNKGNKFVALSFGINLGKNYLSSNVYREKDKFVEQVGISSNSREYTSTSYTANFTKDKSVGYDAQIDKSFDNIDANFYLFNYANRPTQQISLQGSVTKASDGVFFSRPINDSFAIAKVGNFKDVGIYHNNQFVSKTNKSGIAFIPNVPSYIDSKIRIDEDTLPLSAEFSDTTLIINPQRKSGVMANFDVTKVHVAEFSLLNSSGSHVEQDSDIKIDGIDDELFVGYDGKVYVPNIKDLKELKGTACKDSTCCHFNISLAGMANIELIDLGEHKCQ